MMFKGLRVPVLCSPMFLVSTPQLVIAQCRSGVIGSFPSLNARTPADLDHWLSEISTAVKDCEQKLFAVNLIAHASNTRFNQDLDLVLKHKVPIVITSLRNLNKDIINSVHSYNGKVFHDVITSKHARKAAEAGVDGLVLVCAGAGGHAGTQSPFALLPEVKQWYKGTTILAGAITTGQSILAAKALGADLAYMGTRFIATKEASASVEYKQMIVRASADDIVYTNSFSGVHGNYLKESIQLQGFDADNLPHADKSKMDFGDGKKDKESGKPKAWKDIWSAGQGVGQIHSVTTTEEVVAQLELEYQRAKKDLIESLA